MKVKAILFDLDGTLIDTAPDFIAVLNQLLQEEGRSPLEDETIRASVSNGSRALINLAFGLEEGQKEFERLKQKLLDLYLNNIAEQSRFFPGLLPLIAYWHGRNVPWGIITNKPALYTTALLDQLAPQPSPSVVLCPDHVHNAKPHPESILLACRSLQCEPQEVVYVGDHSRDIECAKQAGAISVAAAYGYIDSSININHWNPDYIIQNPTDLATIVNPRL